MKIRHREPLKKFLGYTKVLKKDATGVSSIKKDGVLVSDSRAKPISFPSSIAPFTFW